MHTSSRGWMIKQLKAKGFHKFDGVKIEKLSKQDFLAFYNKNK